MATAKIVWLHTTFVVSACQPCCLLLMTNLLQRKKRAPSGFSLLTSGSADVIGSLPKVSIGGSGKEKALGGSSILTIDRCAHNFFTIMSRLLDGAALSFG